ncbi:VOC family protein [Bradyrhizobium jicamae]|uniref:VOC family protein n=1 Tax=Bradyrhizobium jicamae TaxID=280332 RepID=A0ABS5FK63_9BRAD|nr:VOC family protein [Bradyrhizobium jicamae]MBR0797163.1 VOC family protein [Bradyrhizobium jicamae]MBR0934924.1 VOC family protein [Bradyrhizobium jicamae]
MPHSEQQIVPALANLGFHHLGLAVATPDEAFRYLASLGYSEGNCAFDPLQRVNLAMRHHPTMPDVEVIWPGDGPSPIDKFIKKSGTMIYHLCYTCADTDAALAALSSAGVEIIPVSPPTPAVLFGGQHVSFYHVAGFGLIEMLHTETLPGS